VEGRPADAELLGCWADVPLRRREGFEDKLSLELAAGLLEAPGRLSGPRGRLEPQVGRLDELRFRAPGCSRAVHTSRAPAPRPG
jgi:hypothetical protein